MIRRSGKYFSLLLVSFSIVAFPLGELDHAHLLGYDSSAPDAVRTHDCCPVGTDNETDRGRYCATCFRSLQIAGVTSDPFPQLKTSYPRNICPAFPFHPSSDFFVLYSKRGPPLA